MKKIAICGASNYVNEDFEKANCRTIGRGLIARPTLAETLIATGGTLGHPYEIAKQIMGLAKISAYTPCVSEEEWGKYQDSGLLPSKNFYDKIVWSREEGDIMQRGEARMIPLLEDSEYGIFTLNSNTKGTYQELEIAKEMSLPALVLAPDEGSYSKARRIVKKISDIGVFKDVRELVREMDSY